MEKYAKVIVRSNTFHTDNLFTYKIPEFLKNQIYVGHRVLVPFGKGNKPTEAFVFKISDFYYLIKMKRIFILALILATLVSAHRLHQDGDAANKTEKA